MQRGFGYGIDRPLPYGVQYDAQPAVTESRINTRPSALQADTITVQAYVLGQVDSYTIDGEARSITHTVAMTDTTGVAAALATNLNQDPDFSGLFVATSAAAVVTITARRAGFGWTLVGDPNLVVANVVANAAAEAIPFGRLVIDDGAIAGTQDRAGALARAAYLSAKVVTLTPTPAAGCTYHADVAYQGTTYHATWKAPAVDADDLITDAGADPEITWTTLLGGELGNAASIQLRDPSANDQPLIVSRSGLHVDVQLSTGGAGAITATADDIIAAIAGQPEVQEILGAVITGADGTQMVTATSVLTFVGADDNPLPTEAEISGGLFLSLDANVPADVAVTNVGDDLIFTAAQNGDDFRYSVGADDANAVWAIAVTDPANSDINRVVAGISKLTHRMEQPANVNPLTHGYEPNELMGVFRKGEVVVHREEVVAKGSPVYVRITAGAAPLDQVGAFRQSPAAGCIRLSEKFTWERDLGNGRAVARVNL